MLVKWRLGSHRELATECGLTLRVVFVPSEKNKADVLTRVKKRWLVAAENIQSTVAAAFCLEDSELMRLRSMNHMGVDRTLWKEGMVTAVIDIMSSSSEEEQREG